MYLVTSNSDTEISGRILTFYSILILTHQQQTAFENIVGKGEIARNEQFLLFPQCFLLNHITVSPFVQIFDIISLFAAELEKPKIGISGKRLTKDHFYQLVHNSNLFFFFGKARHRFSISDSTVAINNLG